MNYLGGQQTLYYTLGPSVQEDRRPAHIETLSLLRRRTIQDWLGSGQPVLYLPALW
ncbi:hypothetical protein MYX65_06670 [Acidobacteria bacterium AH-259-L09]|nr:hypothetical protein [Acidobacteria bacterium AH-259-L09]